MELRDEKGDSPQRKWEIFDFCARAFGYDYTGARVLRKKRRSRIWLFAHVKVVCWADEERSVNSEPAGPLMPHALLNRILRSTARVVRSEL